MERKVLNATRRTVTGKQVKALRRQGRLPAVMYGHAVAPIAISLDAHDTALQLAGTSTSTIVTVDLEGEQIAALVREKQKDFIKNNLIHIDFQVVSLTEKIRTTVRVEAHGTSPAVKNVNAIIVTHLNEIEVEAFPQDLPERLIVDLAKLHEVGDTIYVRDLLVSDKVTIFTALDEVIVLATSSAPEPEEEEEEEVSDTSEPEVIERGKKEEEED
ncbi:MAG: 50S ribosomal protein L25 [Anaerolineaceae bacterium]|nr:50S ribosomal protein L25 [Anaerolineaceae bacterium]